MGLREDLTKQIQEAEAKLAILDTFPEDIFHFNTVILLSGDNFKTYLVKVAEETWSNIKTNQRNSLYEWLFEFTVSQTLGYYEAYVLTPQESPIYTKP